MGQEQSDTKQKSKLILESKTITSLQDNLKISHDTKFKRQINENDIIEEVNSSELDFTRYDNTSSYSKVNKDDKSENSKNLNTIQKSKSMSLEQRRVMSELKKYQNTKKYLKKFIEKSKSTLLELDLKDIQEASETKSKRRLKLEFEALDLFVNAVDSNEKEEYYLNDYDKLTNSINDYFKFINSHILNKKDFNFPEKTEEKKTFIYNQFLKHQDLGGDEFNQNSNPTQFEKCVDPSILSIYNIKNHLENLDYEKKLLEQFKSEILDIHDEKFLSKFAISMHKYDNV